MCGSTFGHEKVFLLLLLSVTDGSLVQIIGFLHRDVLLPCNVVYNDIFTYKDLVVNWQTENDDVVHSYHYEADQHQYQAKEFNGRTQLFPEEFPKGNLSLLLKDLQKSDAGIYVCHVFLNDMKGFTTKTMELKVQGINGFTGEQGNSLFPGYADQTTIQALNTINTGETSIKTKRVHSAIIICSLSLLTSCIVLIVYKRLKMKRTKQYKDTERELLLGNDALKGYVRKYKDSVNKTFEPCCQSLSSESGQDGCLERTLSIFQKTTQQQKSEITKDMFKSNDKDSISSEELFTGNKKNPSPRRMLIVGEAGIGKSCLSKGLQSHWAMTDKDLFYECVIYLTFTELNLIKEQVSVKELLGNKCKELEPALPQLLQSDKLLIIFDGFDEFRFDVSEKLPLGLLNCDTPLRINILMSCILSRKLLQETDVLVTTRPNCLIKIHKYFDQTFVIQGFTDDQIKQYYEKLCSSKEVSTCLTDLVKESQMSSLVSIPLLSSALCAISEKHCFPICKGRLNTSSQIMVFLLKCCLKEAVSPTDATGCSQDLESGQKIEDIKIMICKIAKLSFENLVNGVEEIDVRDLGGSFESMTQLLKGFSNFFFNIKKIKNTEILEYHHANIRDMFAALHCVWEIQDVEDLKECLDFWTWGKIPERPRNISLLQNITLPDPIVFQNFLRFFMGLSNYKDVDSLLSDCPTRSENIISALHQWIENEIRTSSESNKLNIFHCILELQDTSLSEKLSNCFKSINFFNTPLTTLDIQALRFSLEKSSLDKADLTLCALSDENLEQLQNVVKRCKEVMLSSNKLTVTGARHLRTILETPDCAITQLRLGTNKLGSRGAIEIWKALEKNSSLHILSLKDNQISDEGTDDMVRSLKKNKSLKELYLCMNNFTKHGLSNIAELKRHCRDMKVVVKICEDEELLSYVEEQVQGLTGDGWKRYDKEWLLRILLNVQEDLNDDEALNPTSNKRVKMLREAIAERLKIIRENKRNINEKRASKKIHTGVRAGP
ncbi:NACHT, LRR and PYD domains-containing protein 3-like isoform 1-T1 [Discoglossus pictus]